MFTFYPWSENRQCCRSGRSWLKRDRRYRLTLHLLLWLPFFKDLSHRGAVTVNTVQLFTRSTFTAFDIDLCAGLISQSAGTEFS